MSEEVEQDEKRELIIETYKKITKEKGELPTYKDFLLAETISREMIRSRFGGIEELHRYFKENHGEFLNENFTHVDNFFSSERSAKNSNKKVYLITTAVANSKAHSGFLDAMKNFSAKNNAQIVIMPCESITNSFENRTGVMDPVFNDSSFLFVQEDTPLNDNLSLCSIQVSAKQIKPITGLSRLGNREGSYVFASPKQFLEYVPSGNSRTKNYSIMTTGACTVPKYYTETFVSKRLSYIAERDHTLGAIIVEIVNDKEFYFRQIQCDDSGAFCDLGLEYLPNGETRKVPANVILGDLHGIEVDAYALETFLDVFEKMDVLQLYLHDVFDGKSISHHITDISEKAKRAMYSKGNLVDELEQTLWLVKEIDERLKPNVINIVKSNHDEFLTRYLAAGRYVYDPENHYSALKIAPAMFEEQDVLECGFEYATNNQIPGHWKFLQREDSSKIAGIECGAHGDMGLNGARPSISSLEKIYGDSVTGHSHTAAIQRGVWKVGTLSKLDLGYNRGPSSWTHTCGIVYPNGQRQLLNSINGSITNFEL